jgi:hypothetical protein
MNRTKPQRIDPKQVKQFLADRQKKSATAGKNLAIDAATAYQVAYEAMLKDSLALMLSQGQRPAGSTWTSHSNHRVRTEASRPKSCLYSCKRCAIDRLI